MNQSCGDQVLSALAAITTGMTVVMKAMPHSSDSPRKAAISLYVFTSLDEHKELFNDLGKFKTGKACIYIKKLSDVNEEKLASVMKKTIAFLTSKYEVA